MRRIFEEFENFSVEKKHFRLRWDSSPGFSIAGRLHKMEREARGPNRMEREARDENVPP